MLRKTIICAALASVSIHSFAANWKEVATGTTAVFYLDTSSIVRAGPLVKVWRKSVLKRPEIQPGGTVPTAYMIDHSTFNCAEKTLAIVQFTDYDQRGSTITTYKEANPEFRDVVPESINEGFAMQLCQWAAQHYTVCIYSIWCHHAPTQLQTSADR